MKSILIGSLILTSALTSYASSKHINCQIYTSAEDKLLKEEVIKLNEFDNGKIEYVHNFIEDGLSYTTTVGAYIFAAYPKVRVEVHTKIAERDIESFTSSTIFVFGKKLRQISEVGTLKMRLKLTIVMGVLPNTV